MDPAVVELIIGVLAVDPVAIELTIVVLTVDPIAIELIIWVLGVDPAAVVLIIVVLAVDPAVVELIAVVWVKATGTIVSANSREKRRLQPMARNGKVKVSREAGFIACAFASFYHKLASF